MPALPIIVLAEQGYTLPDWFILLLTYFAVVCIPVFVVSFIKLCKILMKGKNDKNEK